MAAAQLASATAATASAKATAIGTCKWQRPHIWARCCPQLLLRARAGSQLCSVDSTARDSRCLVVATQGAGGGKQHAAASNRSNNHQQVLEFRLSYANAFKARPPEIEPFQDL